jgi:hypothetical protein
MFIELMPLIERRAITITVAAISGGRIRVNVVPMPVTEDNKVNERIGYKVPCISVVADRPLVTFLHFLSPWR